MFFILKSVTRRIVNKQKAKRSWIARVMMIVAIVKWIDRKLNGPRVVYLKKNESIVVGTESRTGKQ